MSKSKKILNYTVMVCTIIAAIIFSIDQNWSTALWAFIAFVWMVNSHLAEDSYYDCKERLNKLTDDYIISLNGYIKELKELKDKIAELKNN